MREEGDGMREIKFRALWGYKWVYGYYLCSGEWGNIHQILEKDGSYALIDPKTLGQYTGLKDNTKWEDLTKDERTKWVQVDSNSPSKWKGKEIYEGDILKVFNWGYKTKNELLGIVSVIWDNDEKGWGYSESKEVVSDDRYDIFRNVEKIGTIHENPELLKP